MKVTMNRIKHAISNEVHQKTDAVKKAERAKCKKSKAKSRKKK